MRKSALRIMLWRIRQRVVLLLYYCLARHLPISYRPGGRIGRRLRGFCAKRLFAQCGKNVNVEHGAWFRNGNKISIGDNSGIGIDAWIPGTVAIGRNVMMGPQVMIISRNHRVDRVDVPMREQGHAPDEPVTIDDDVWIGARSILLPGVHVGRGSIIGAGAVVTRDVPPYTVVAGVPAKVIRHRATVESRS